MNFIKDAYENMTIEEDETMIYSNFPYSSFRSKKSSLPIDGNEDKYKRIFVVNLIRELYNGLLPKEDVDKLYISVGINPWDVWSIFRGEELEEGKE